MLILGGEKTVNSKCSTLVGKMFKKTSSSPQALTVKMLEFSILSVQGSESRRLRVNKGRGFIPHVFSKILKNIQKCLLNKGVYFTLKFFPGLHTIRDLAEIIR